MKKNKQWFEEELEARALTVDVDNKDMVLTLRKSDITNLTNELGAFVVAEIPAFVHEYYEDLEYWEQEEFLTVIHVLESVYSGSFDNMVVDIAEWIKMEPEQYIAFVNAVKNDHPYDIKENTCFYGVYDTQIGGYKAGMAYTNKSEAREGVLDRIYSIHTDMYESDGYDSWDEFMEEEGWDDNKLIIFQGYEIHLITERDYEKILDSEEYGLLTGVELDD